MRRTSPPAHQCARAAWRRRTCHQARCRPARNTKAAATAVAARSGSRVAVIGVFQTRNESWALLQLADGRIVKAAKGMDLSAFKVTRVDANKIWIRNGNSEKGLRTGDVFQVN